MYTQIARVILKMILSWFGLMEDQVARLYLDGFKKMVLMLQKMEKRISVRMLFHGTKKLVFFTLNLLCLQDILIMQQMEIIISQIKELQQITSMLCYISSSINFQKDYPTIYGCLENHMQEFMFHTLLGRLINTIMVNLILI